MTTIDENPWNGFAATFQGTDLKWTFVRNEGRWAATLNNVLVHLQPALSAIAKQAGVLVIVKQPLYREPTVQEVDITAELVKRFEPHQ